MEESRKFKSKLDESLERINNLRRGKTDYFETVMHSDQFKFLRDSNDQLVGERLHMLISDQLQELDNQLAVKAEKLKMIKEGQSAQKLQRVVKHWLASSHLKKFIRNVLKVKKLVKIVNSNKARHAFI